MINRTRFPHRTAFAAVAWDIDGTLVDSEPLHHRALLAACNAFGCDITDLPAETYRGVHMADVWKDLKPRLPTHLDQMEWLAAVQDHYIARRDELVEIAGAREIMETLQARGIRQACVSNSARAIVDANLAALGVADLLEFSISVDDVASGKPDPEPYLQALSRFRLPAGSVLAVEDSDAGCRSASCAGLFVVRVGSPRPPHSETIVRDLNDVPGLLFPAVS